MHGWRSRRGSAGLRLRREPGPEPGALRPRGGKAGLGAGRGRGGGGAGVGPEGPTRSRAPWRQAGLSQVLGAGPRCLRGWFPWEPGRTGAEPCCPGLNRWSPVHVEFVGLSRSRKMNLRCELGTTVSNLRLGTHMYLTTCVSVFVCGRA